MPTVVDAKANRFFHAAATALLPLVSEAAARLKTKCSGCEFWATGHSLGGAVALLLAYLLAVGNVAHPIVYTFGQPRVSNGALAQDMDARLPVLLRLVSDDDLIPHIPLCSAGVTTEYCELVNNSYYHAGVEIWFPRGEYENGVLCGFRECVLTPKNEDFSCSDGIFNLAEWSLADHHAYFSVLGKGFCPDAESDQIFV